MSNELSALAALVIAIIALVVAAGQLAQQLLATAYVLRKCDGIVTGGLIKGGVRQWHWRQYRFTVNYHAINFTLPPSVYSSLGVSPAVLIGKSSRDLWPRATKSRERRTTAQGCWISFVQDLVEFTSVRPEDLGLSEESGDRVPDDLTVGPTRVDAITVLLTCIAMGMQVYKYNPTEGEIALAGSVGSISSSNHQVLGCLLHYNVTTGRPSMGADLARAHGRALQSKDGVWANAVFGRFQDRSYRLEMFGLETLILRKQPVLKEQGWPEGSVMDTIGGAACFMVFAHVDACEAVPPTVVRPWCAHFAEFIVKAHHKETIKNSKAEKNESIAHDISESQRITIGSFGCSSPYLPWSRLGQSRKSLKPYSLTELYDYVLSRDVIASQDLVNGLLSPSFSVDIAKLDDRVSHSRADPSTYVPVATSWGIIQRADYLISQSSLIFRELAIGHFPSVVEMIVAKAVSPLAEMGAPSWTQRLDELEIYWSEIFPAACSSVLSQRKWPSTNDHDLNLDLLISKHARLSILRAAYYTIMMRAASPIGPGLTEGCRIDTAMAYMA